MPWSLVCVKCTRVVFGDYLIVRKNILWNFETTSEFHLGSRQEALLFIVEPSLMCAHMSLQHLFIGPLGGACAHVFSGICPCFVHDRWIQSRLGYIGRSYKCTITKGDGVRHFAVCICYLSLKQVTAPMILQSTCAGYCRHNTRITVSRSRAVMR